jgi:hypothetical protein
MKFNKPTSLADDAKSGQVEMLADQEHWKKTWN